jgi:hypothetical protein
MFLNLTKKQVDKIGGGKNKPTDIVDVASIPEKSVGPRKTQKYSKRYPAVDRYPKGEGCALVLVYRVFRGLIAVFRFMGKSYLTNVIIFLPSALSRLPRLAKAKYVLRLPATLTRMNWCPPILFITRPAFIIICMYMDRNNWILCYSVKILISHR